MIKEAWINLPVKDLERAKAFYKHIGLTPSEHGTSELSAGFKIGRKNVILMLFEQATFEQICRAPVTNSLWGAEVLLSIDTETRKEIDELAEKVKYAGGTLFAEPEASQGWLYGFGFSDPDGHRWNGIYMDMDKFK